MTQSLHQLWSYLMLASLAVVCSFFTHAAPAHGQLSVLGELSSPNELLPNGVHRYGSFEVTWVLSPLTKNKLFQIASPTVADRSSNNPQEQLPVEIRAKSIEDLLGLEIERIRIDPIAGFLPTTSEQIEKELSQAQVLISTLQNYNVVQINHSDTSRPRTIATVTESDADFYSETPKQIATTWQSAIASEIEQAEKLYSPDTLRRRVDSL